MNPIKEANTFLLYGAIFDAFLMSVEFLERSKDNEAFIQDVRQLSQYHSHPEYQTIPGKYTDDTQMSLAIAKVLTNCKPPYTKEMFAQALVDEFKHDPRPGYAKGFYKFLQEVKDGKDFMAKIDPQSRKNGAATRSVPLGAIKNAYYAMEVAKLQASLTHNTEEGIVSSQMVALASHFAFYESGDFSKLPQYYTMYFKQEIRQKYGFILHCPYPEGCPPGKMHYGFPSAITTVHAVIDILKRNLTMTEAIKKVIEYGGDTDTVGTIVGQIMSIKLEKELIGLDDNEPLPKSGLPEFMFMDLEKDNPLTGFCYLLETGRKLIDIMKK